jgi:hypothetical protein
MGELNFQTGQKTYTVNGGAQITFEPADIKFANAVIAAFGHCFDISKAANITSDMSLDESYEATVKLESDIREEINRAFGYDVCAKVFPNMSVIAVADGLPVWTNFVMAVVDEIDIHAFEGQAKGRQRVQQYMEKYSAKYGKYNKQ